jgi:DNA polymerase III subunit chi
VKDADNNARNTAIRFYTLSDAAGSARLRQACVLTEQAYLAGQRVLVWLEDAPAQARFDDLLWSFGERSFVPHEPLAADPATAQAPVQLHSGALAEGMAGAFDTLVMLRAEAVPEVLRFTEVIEVLDADPACRNAGRARFRWYREQGAAPQHIEVTQ